jgi:hypothetical protein
MNEPRKQRDSVTLRPKGNNVPRRKTGRLADEPEMKELSRMIESGELDPDRAARHARDEAKKGAKR